MRIISDFKDYYDFGQQYGYDPEIIYHRKESSVELGKLGRHYTYDCGRLTFYQVIVGFCGEVHMGIRFMEPWEPENGRYEYKWHTFYSAEACRKYVNTQRKTDIIAYDKPMKKSFWGTETPRRHIEGMFRGAGHNNIVFREEYNVPIYVWSGRDSITFLNCELANFDFARVYDGLTAYQKLSMWYGSRNAVSEENIPEVSDEDLAKAKGYGKMSFKQETPGKKERRKKNRERKAKRRSS